MKKWISLLVCVLLCLGLFSGCSTSVGSLSDEMRAEIVNYYGYKGTDSKDTVAGMRYYGTYNGYVVLMDAGDMTAVAEVDIGGRVFEWSSSALILDAYKDGQAQPLKDVYEAGGITEKDLDKILDVHQKHIKEYLAELQSGTR